MGPALPDPTLASLLAAVDTANARLRSYLELCAASPDATTATNDEWPTNSGHPDLATVAEGAAFLGVSDDTVYRYCEKFDIGKEYSAGWRVSYKRMTTFKRSRRKT